jgi:DNA-directed RNA polymerase specialized sigma24 family protein
MFWSSATTATITVSPVRLRLVVAVRMRDLARALRGLDDESRALLELSMRRGMSDEEIAAVLLAETPEVERRRADLFERLADELRLDGREARDELFATLQDLPANLWRR